MALLVGVAYNVDVSINTAEVDAAAAEQQLVAAGVQVETVEAAPEEVLAAIPGVEAADVEVEALARITPFLVAPPLPLEPSLIELRLFHTRGAD